MVEPFVTYPFMIYDQEGYPADADTMMIDMIMYNGDHLLQIKYMLLVFLVVYILKTFRGRRN